MSLFDDLLNKGGNKPTEANPDSNTGQGRSAGNPATDQGSSGTTGSTQTTDPTATSTVASDIIIPTQTPEMDSVVPNVIVTDVPTAEHITPNITIDAPNPQTPIVSPVIENTQINTQTPVGNEIPNITLDHLAPIQETTTPQEILQTNVPTPISSVEEINTVASSPTVSQPTPTQVPNITIPEVSKNTDTTEGLFEMTTQDAHQNSDFLVDTPPQVTVEETKKPMTLEDFVSSSLQSIDQMIENLDAKKLSTENKADEYKNQKEDFAQKEQDAYDAIIEIEKKKARVETMRKYFEKQQKGEEPNVSGSVETDLTELSTKEAVKKTVAPKKQTTRTRRKTTARKTTTTRKKTTAKKEVENAPLI